VGAKCTFKSASKCRERAKGTTPVAWQALKRTLRRTLNRHTYLDTLNRQT